MGIFTKRKNNEAEVRKLLSFIEDHAPSELLDKMAADGLSRPAAIAMIAALVTTAMHEKADTLTFDPVKTTVALAAVTVALTR